jgi:hypothetical protein
MKEHIKFINSVKEKLNKLSCIPIKYLGKWTKWNLIW